MCGLFFLSLINLRVKIHIKNIIKSTCLFFRILSVIFISLSGDKDARGISWCFQYKSMVNLKNEEFLIIKVIESGV